jgi:hypothetical protein
VPSSSRQKSKPRAASKKPAPARAPSARKASAPPKKSAGKKSPPRSSSKPAAPAAPRTPPVELEVPLPDGRRHLLSLSFLRDGDEFMARLETDSGHITELKNRALDQLLTLVASELEDLIE